MNARSILKPWMRLHWRKFVRYVNRLERDLERRARARRRAPGNYGSFTTAGPHETPAEMPEPLLDLKFGRYSPNLAVRRLFGADE
jgi:hypothetical protein